MFGSQSAITHPFSVPSWMYNYAVQSFIVRYLMSALARIKWVLRPATCLGQAWLPVDNFHTFTGHCLLNLANIYPLMHLLLLFINIVIIFLHSISWPRDPAGRLRRDLDHHQRWRHEGDAGPEEGLMRLILWRP